MPRDSKFKNPLLQRSTETTTEPSTETSTDTPTLPPTVPSTFTYTSTQTAHRKRGAQSFEKTHERITLWIDKGLKQRFEALAEEQGRAKSTLLDEAIAAYLEGDPQIAALETEIKQLRERLLDVEAQPVTPSHVEQKTQPRPKVEVPPLPDDLIPLLTFSNQHFVSHNEANRLRGTGSIKVVKGIWTIGKQIVKIALDAKGRRDFWVQFHEAPGFRSCDECPHTIGP